MLMDILEEHSPLESLWVNLIVLLIIAYGLLWPSGLKIVSKRQADLDYGVYFAALLLCVLGQVT